MDVSPIPAVVWTCLRFIKPGQNHFARHSERGKKTRQIEEEVGRQNQEMNRPGVRQVREGSGEQGKMEETGCEIICGAPKTLAVKGLMMMMMMMMMMMSCCTAQSFSFSAPSSDRSIFLFSHTA